MATCRSSAGCNRPAGHGRFGTFCEEHAAALAALRSAHFTADGTARAQAAAPAEQGPTAEDDALRIALEVRREGRVARSVLQDELGFTYRRFRRAVELAGRWEWIVAGRALSPGPVLPSQQYAVGATAEPEASVSAVSAV
ncbi:MAG TPA: hypothetical protein VGR11_13330 [Solirubrobacteraceae bacterium]|nr:hypothetical protein [Solirubrobacteraceae bacterium]